VKKNSIWRVKQKNNESLKTKTQINEGEIKMTQNTTEKQTINSKLVTIEEAADRLGVTKSYIKRMCRDQKIRAFKVGKFWRMTEPSLSEFVDDLNVNSHKTKLSQDVQNKLRFHSMIRILDAAPEKIERLNNTIGQVKETFRNENNIKRIALASKLKNLVVDRETKKQMVKEIPEAIDELADVAYPGMKEIVNENPDEIESFFANLVVEEKKQEEKKSPVVQMKTAGSNR
jgi:excisionase family DNA binding protein